MKRWCRSMEQRFNYYYRRKLYKNFSIAISSTTNLTWCHRRLNLGLREVEELYSHLSYDTSCTLIPNMLFAWRINLCHKYPENYRTTFTLNLFLLGSQNFGIKRLYALLYPEKWDLWEFFTCLSECAIAVLTFDPQLSSFVEFNARTWTSLCLVQLCRNLMQRHECLKTVSD